MSSPNVQGLLIAVCTCLLPAIPLAAQNAGYVKVLHVGTGGWLSAADDTGLRGGRIVLKDEAGLARQWKLEKDGDYFKIVNRKSGRVLDVEFGSREEGAAIIQYHDKAQGNDNQRWTWVGDGPHRLLKSKASEMVLSVDNQGNAVQRRAEGIANAQLWRVSEVKDGGKTPGGYVKLVHANTGSVLSVAGESDADGAKAVLKDEAGLARRWILIKEGAYFRLVNARSQHGLAPEDGSREPAPVVQDYQMRTDDQQWAWVGAGAERRLKSKWSGLVLDVDAHGGVFQRKADSKARSQLWRAVEIKPAGTRPSRGYFKLVHVATGSVLSVENESFARWTRAVVKDEDGCARHWKLEKAGPHYKVVNRRSGQVLDVENGSVAEGAAIIQHDWASKSNDNQRWGWAVAGKDRRLKSKKSGLVLDVDGQGYVIQRKADSKARSQLWRVVEIKAAPAPAPAGRKGAPARRSTIPTRKS
jgi:hypothetical protein